MIFHHEEILEFLYKKCYAGQKFQIDEIFCHFRIVQKESRNCNMSFHLWFFIMKRSSSLFTKSVTRVKNFKSTRFSVTLELYVRIPEIATWVFTYNFSSWRYPWVSVTLELYVRIPEIETWVSTYDFPSWRDPRVCSQKVLRGSKISNR